MGVGTRRPRARPGASATPVHDAAPGRTSRAALRTDRSLGGAGGALSRAGEGRP